MTVEPLSLDHGPELRKRLFGLGTGLSEYSFANLYLFREVHRYEVISMGDCMFIRGITYDKKRFLMSCCDLRHVCGVYRERFLSLMEGVDMVFPVPESWLGFFASDLYGQDFSEDDSDYLFTREKLQNYPGRKLHKKRNLLKQCLELYTVTTEPLSGDNREDALKVLELWQNDIPLDADQTDYAPCVEALELMKPLGLTGTLFSVDGRPAGFTLGEVVGDNTYALHFAKADKKVKGLYQLMFSRTAETLDSSIAWINLEQDLGQESLRAAKASYCPDRMVKKFRVRKKTGG